MPYVERDTQGKIKGRYLLRQPSYAEEFLPDDSPELQPDPALLAAQAKAQARDLRTQLFARFDGLQASAIATGNATLATEIESVKAALRSITSDVDLTGLATLADMQRAYKTRWNQIRAPLSAGLKTAFALLDA